MEQLALFGYSGHAFVVADAIFRTGDQIYGYFEKAEANFNPFNLKYLGKETEKEKLGEIKSKALGTIVGIGDNATRKRLLNFLIGEKVHISTVIHPAAIIGRHVSIGNGSFLAAGVKINPVVIIGTGVILNTNCIIEHECQIGNYSHIAPGAVIAGNVRVGEGSFIGAGAVVKQGIFIGKNVIIGAGAVVLKNVPDQQIWVGNPAKELKK